MSSCTVCVCVLEDGFVEEEIIQELSLSKIYIQWNALKYKIWLILKISTSPIKI